VYPQITAAYKVVGDLMVFYAGAEGGLQQNSYRDFTTINPFLSPTLQIRPTDQQYDLFAGLKGKLANNISYNVRGSMLSEKYKPLFRSNYVELPVAIGANQSFAYGNSFTLVYDDVNTLSFYGEVNANLSKNFSFGLNGTFSTFTTDNESEAWNLPTMRLGGNIGVNFTEKWFAGVDLFLVGSRYDQYIVASTLDPAFYEFKKVTLDSYFDLNANVGYRHNDRLTGFVRANNILNQSYEKWFNFPVQQFQIVLGANYKFDF
jgi:outer membrane receptor protein involved in Fe transport